jgi:hypothetical protein
MCTVSWLHVTTRFIYRYDKNSAKKYVKPFDCGVYVENEATQN